MSGILQARPQPTHPSMVQAVSKQDSKYLVSLGNHRKRVRIQVLTHEI
jgi:hypothetical protein